MTAPEPPVTNPETRRAGAREIVHRIALAIADERIPPGDRAALRREELGTAFWKIAGLYLEPAGLLAEGPSRDEAERRWAAILGGIARTPRLHARGRRLGNALAEASVTEDRVLRLARAHGDGLHKIVRAVTQQLASGGLQTDWADVADLILSDGSNWEDEVRRRMCRDFYRTDRGSLDARREES